MPVKPSELDVLARKLPEPRHYYTGLTLPSNPLPDNILLFHRDSRAELETVHRRNSSHRRHVLMVPLRCAGQVYLDGVTVRHGPGRALLIFPFQTHRVASLSAERINWLYITFDLANEVSAMLEPLRSRPAPLSRPDLHALTQLTRSYLDEPDRGLAQSLRIAVQLAGVLNHLASQTPAEPEPEPPTVGHGPHKPQRALSGVVADACRYINQHMHEPVHARDVARAMGLSEVYLRKLFVRELSQPLARHMREVRIIKACELLATTDAPIASVARATGFGASDTFSRTFRHETGLTPSAYRRSRQRVLP